MLPSLPVIVVGARGKRLGEPVIHAINESNEGGVIAEIVRPGDERPSPSGHLVRHSFSEITDPPEESMARQKVVVFYAVKADALLLRLQEANAHGFRRHVIGTTGIPKADMETIEELARGDVVVVASNFSEGANVIAEKCAEFAFRFHGCDVEIVEAHHNQKEDAPSGTALLWARAIAAARGVNPAEVITYGRHGRGKRKRGEICIHALRGGAVTGFHRVTFFGEYDEVTLEHNARSPMLFATGALTAIRWAWGNWGARSDRIYRMADVLGLKHLIEYGVY